MRSLFGSLFGPLFGLLLALLAANAVAQSAQSPAQFKPVPALNARVTDEVGMLTADQRQRLDTALADYETQTGSQIAVLLVASTEPEAIEQYGIRVTDAWKLGRKGLDDGVLLLVARDNPKALRRLRIEAGRGVQGVLTDAQSKRILQDVIAPHFRQNDYYGGLTAGVGAIEALLNQEKFPAPANQGTEQGAAQGQGDAGGSGVIGSIFMVVVGLLILRSVFRPRRSRLGNAGDGWGSGAAGFVLGNILANAGRGGRGGGFSDGGGFSGGGFSGGGGSFDGGGASGDW